VTEDQLPKRPRASLRARLFPYTPWWRNLWFRDGKDAFLFLLILFTAWAYWHDTHAYRDVYENPCEYCPFAQPDPRMPQYVMTSVGGNESWALPVFGTSAPHNTSQSTQ
jgi:hypothetical protein